MVIQLKELYRLPGEKRGINCVIPEEEIRLSNGPAFSTPISVEGEIANRAGIVTLTCSVGFSLKPLCDRCLTEFTREYSYEVSHTLVRSLNNSEDDFGDYIVTEGDELDLTELILSDILLLLPSKLLCREDCKGLCSACGADLNVTQCDCGEGR